MTAFEERPHSPYYGSADATPLFLVLLDEYERWTGDRELVRELEREARAALNWIDEYADLHGDGYVWYQRRNEKTGLENQCWKDSWDSISFRDGRLPGLPARDLRAAGLRLRREAPRPPAWPGSSGTTRPSPTSSRRRPPTSSGASTATSGSRTASTSRSRSTPTEAQVDALTSNIGHLLWSGIVDDARRRPSPAPDGPRLFSGWGIRTMAEGEGRYNPIGYHVGTVWPHDNSFIAWGLRRYGFKDEAAAIAAGHPRRGGVLRGPAARGVRRLRALADQVSGPVPDGVQPAGLVDRRAAAPPADHAGPRADG